MENQSTNFNILPPYYKDDKNENNFDNKEINGDPTQKEYKCGNEFKNFPIDLEKSKNGGNLFNSPSQDQEMTMNNLNKKEKEGLKLESCDKGSNLKNYATKIYNLDKNIKVIRVKPGDKLYNSLNKKRFHRKNKTYKNKLYNSIENKNKNIINNNISKIKLLDQLMLNSY